MDERESDLLALGATPEQIAAAGLRPVKKDFEVLEENWETVMIFLKMQTQWNVSMAGLTGLNYSALDYLSRLYSVKDPVSLFEGIQVMELAALGCFSKRNP